MLSAGTPKLSNTSKNTWRTFNKLRSRLYANYVSVMEWGPDVSALYRFLDFNMQLVVETIDSLQISPASFIYNSTFTKYKMHIHCLC